MAIKLDIDVGDIVLTGKFRNKRTKVKEIGTDELGQPTINGKPILKLRIEKLLPKEKQSKETRENMTEFSDKRFKQLAGLLKEQKEQAEASTKKHIKLAHRWMERLGYSGETDEQGNPTLFFDIRSFLRIFDIEETGVSNGYFYIEFKRKK